MGIAISMVVITVGAIMRFAVTAEGQGFNVHTTGMVLMIVGVIGGLLSIGFWASWGGFGRVRRGPVTGVQSSIVSPPPTIVRAQPVVVSAPPVIVSPPRTVVRETEVL